MDILRRIVVRRPRLCTTTLRNYCAPSVESSKPDTKEVSWPRRVVSGLQPTGALHVGNYFGCVRPLLRAQERGEDLTVFIADLHALTQVPAPGTGGGALAERTLQLGAMLLASGLDPDRCTLFVQSAVARHAELCWVLACLATQARLAQLPQYRTRAADPAADRLGVLLYPVLQAADVLVYRGTHVPVGADQLQHLQLAAQLVKTFHHRYGRAFPTPQPLLAEEGSRLRSLRAPERKMSKSDPDGKSRILVVDSADDIRRKVRKAVTDFTPQVTFDPESRPGVSNLVTLHCLATGITPDEAVEENDHLNTAQYKAVVAEAVVTALAPVRARALELSSRPRLVRDALSAGAARAARRADQTYADVARLTGVCDSAPGRRPARETSPVTRTIAI